MYNQISLLYSKGWHNIVNQLYFNKKNKVQKKETQKYFKAEFCFLSELLSYFDFLIFLFLAPLNQYSEYRGSQRDGYENPQHSRTYTEISLKKKKANTVNIVHYTELKHMTELYPLAVHSYSRNLYITIWPERCQSPTKLTLGPGLYPEFICAWGSCVITKEILGPQEDAGKK